MDDITTGMVDPWGQIVRECGAGNLPWKSVALTYAFGIRQSETDGEDGLRAANVAIRERFKTDKDPTGLKALERVKTLAWQYVRGEKTPGAR